MWIELSPQLLLSLTDDYVQLIDIPHTLLLAVITAHAVAVLNQHTLIAVGRHQRPQELISHHGDNVEVQAKQTSTKQFSLVVRTAEDFLITYTGKVDQGHSLYEVSKNDQVIQLGLPVAKPDGFLLKNIFNKMFTSFDNLVEDEDANFTLTPVRLQMSKVVKIGVGIGRWWLKPHSHNIIVFNHKNARDDVNGDVLQIINTENNKNEIFTLSQQQWYNGSRVRHIEYNTYNNFLWVINEANELWRLEVIKGEGRISLKGDIMESFDNFKSVDIAFAPNFALVQLDSTLRLYLNHNYIKTITESPGKVVWSSNEKFFVFVSQGSWKVISHLGHTLFDSATLANELPQPWLQANSVHLGGPNLYVVNKHLYLINLQNIMENFVFYTPEYLGIASKKFPMPAKFKHMPIDIAVLLQGQFAIAHGNDVAVLTPNTHQLLWYFCTNDHEPLNISKTFWFQDYLGVISQEDEDEVILFDTRKTKYMHSGFQWDTDAILVKHPLGGRVMCCCMQGHQLVLVSSDYKFKVLTFSFKDGAVTTSATSIHLASIKHKLGDIVEVKKLGEAILLLGAGGKLMVLRHSEGAYELLPITDGVEWFRTTYIQYTNGGADYIYALRGNMVHVYRDFEFDTPIVVLVDNFSPVKLSSGSLLDLVGTEPTMVHGVFKNKVSHKLVLHHFIEHELTYSDTNEVTAAVEKYRRYTSYSYCLELLLVKYLTEIDNPPVLAKLLLVVDDSTYINCLRKIEIGYWDKFFDALGTTPHDYMQLLVARGAVENCYHFLIVYLNKSEVVENHEMIVTVYNMLQKACKWDWCFELCRFVKLIDPDFLPILSRT